MQREIWQKFQTNHGKNPSEKRYTERRQLAEGSDCVASVYKTSEGPYVALVLVKSPFNGNGVWAMLDESYEPNGHTSADDIKAVVAEKHGGIESVLADGPLATGQIADELFKTQKTFPLYMAHLASRMDYVLENFANPLPAR